MEKKILELTNKYLPRVMELRKELHKIPELGFQEFKTAEVIKNELERIGIPFKSEVATTGVVGLIEGGKPGKTILLRADIDGLPLEEESKCEFKSEIKGNMHACGHDGHTASLLGVAMILNELKEELEGNVKLVFQPAEEAPGGAKPMIDEGVLENPKVDAAIGCHILPSEKAGTILTREGIMMAHPTAFDIIIKGKGGHGARPEDTIDPVIIGCQVVTNFQNIRSRGISTLKPAVISCCSIKAGDACNVIPDTLSIKGTIRTFDGELMEEILKRMDDMLKGITSAYGAEYEFIPVRMYPELRNDSELFKFSKEILTKIFGEEKIKVLEDPMMGAEDFSYFGKCVPANFFFVGVGDEQEEIETIPHHPKFNWNEKHLNTSMQGMAQIAFDYLNKN